jgi:CO dehydrogenase maturation factor
VKIAVTGKGGVGKTLVAGVLAHFFVKKGLKVLAIDADPTPNLALTLGIPLKQAKNIVPISENTNLIESKTETGIASIYNLSFTVEDIIDKFSVGSPYGVNLLVMGTVRSAGSGCMCPANAVVRALLYHLLVKRDEVVVMDMEAGIEHMGRGTAKHVEIMLIVVDSSLKSLETARKLQSLARQAEIKKIFVIGNKVMSQDEKKLIEKFVTSNNIELLGFIPYDEQVLRADMKGESPLKYAEESKGIKSIQEMGEKLLAFKQSHE